MSLDEVPMKMEVKWEPEDVEDAATDLYAEHEVKQELVLGPELLQTPDVSSVLQENVENERNICELGQWTLKFCFVRLERLPLSTEGNLQMQLFVCEFCDSVFKFRYRLRTHEQGHVRHLLLDSDKVDTSSFGYINHEQSSKKEQQKCDTSDACMAQPLQETNISSNEKIDKEPFIHKISDDNLPELPKQQDEDTSESPYRDLLNKEGTHFCAICSTDIRATLWDFEKHLLNHIKNNPELKQAFKEKIKLSIHKQYICDVCQKQFKRRYLLYRHRKLHTEQALSCDICKKKFTRKFHLLRHIERPCIAKLKMYPCKLCDKSYARLCDYNRHLRISHAGEIHTYHHMLPGREDYTAKLTDSTDSTYSNSNGPLFRMPADNVFRSKDLNSSVQNVNFQESTLFNRLQLLNQTLNSNRVGKSKPNCP